MLDSGCRFYLADARILEGRMMDRYEGFAYLVRNSADKQFVLSATFAKSKTQTKKYFKRMNDYLAKEHKPMFERIALVRCTLLIEEVEETYENPRP